MNGWVWPLDQYSTAISLPEMFRWNCVGISLYILLSAIDRKNLTSWNPVNYVHRTILLVSEIRHNAGKRMWSNGRINVDYCGFYATGNTRYKLTVHWNENTRK